MRQIAEPPLHDVVKVAPATLDQQAILANLLELYSHDFSEFIALELQPDGRYGYSRLPLYWQEPNRYPFLVNIGEHLAGFVLVTRTSRLSGDPAVYDMTEFFVVRSYRKQGLGAAVARLIWEQFPGLWEVRVVENNQSAVTFWRGTTARFAGSSVHEQFVELDGMNWHVFSFVSPTSLDPRAIGPTASIQRLQREQVPAAVAVLRDAFYGYPVMRHVIGTNSPDYAHHLSTLVQFFVIARMPRSEPVLGAISGSDLAAVALVSDPGGPPSPPEMTTLREAVWELLGADARMRYEELGAVWGTLAVEAPRIHLNMIGVRPSLRGGGYGRRLLDEVHDLARRTTGCTGVTLTTEDRANLTLYEHFGYEITGHARVGAQLETWALFRPC